MTPPRIQLFHRSFLMSECLSSALTSSGSLDCSVLRPADFTGDSPGRIVENAADLLLLDATLAGEMARRVADQFQIRLPACKIVLMIPEQAIDRILDLARISNHGCVFEGACLADLRVAIQIVLSGQFYCSPQLAGALVAQVGQTDKLTRNGRHCDDSLLTARECEVLELIAEERLGNKQIARRLGVSLFTVKNHVHNILEKLGVQDRHEAVQLAQRRALLVHRTQGPAPQAVRFPR